jgi:hypothetical protein
MSSQQGRPEAMRAQLRNYVAALHHAYLGVAALLPPGERASLPLLAASRMTVAVAAARHLHVLAFTDALPAPSGQEVEEHDADGDFSWNVRFFDPVVIPQLGLLPETDRPAAAEVRRILGVSDVLYHLTVTIGGGLTPHHAQHAGTGLANDHAAAGRDAQFLRARLRGRESLVDEFAVAERVGLHAALRLLATCIAPGDSAVAAAATGDNDNEVRRALVAHVRSRPEVVP